MDTEPVLEPLLRVIDPETGANVVAIGAVLLGTAPGVLASRRPR